MYLLGINEGHCSTAALLGDGKILHCISEERLSRSKNQCGFPVRAVQQCLKLAGLNIGDVDQMILTGLRAPPLVRAPDGYYAWPTSYEVDNSFSGIYSLRQALKSFKQAEKAVSVAVSSLVSPVILKRRIKTAAELTGLSPAKITAMDHHLAHALGAVFGSGWAAEDLLVLTVDGEGDFLSATVRTWRGGKCELVAQSYFTDSLGHFYSSITGLLGMKRLEHEYKVMGMAPYAMGPEADAVYAILADEIRFDEQNLTFSTRVHSHVLQDRLERILRRRRFDHIASAAQKVLEDLLVSLVRAAIRRTGLSSVVAAGGTFMNVKANGLIVGRPEVKKFYAMPSCGDESLAIGACYGGYHERNGSALPQPLTNLYLGSAPDEQELESQAAQRGFTVERPASVAARAAELLATGRIVARCAGGMEFGARALGNRSILADPAAPGVVEQINRAIKHRDFWMPFAPVINADRVAEYITHPEWLGKTEAAFMMVTFDSTERGRRDLPGALHPYDKSMRPQVLAQDGNPGYHAILTEFEKRTGRFGLLNTSFNIHGYPIVHSTEDALQVLAESGLEHVIIGPYLVHKHRP